KKETIPKKFGFTPLLPHLFWNTHPHKSITSIYLYSHLTLSASPDLLQVTSSRMPHPAKLNFFQTSLLKQCVHQCVHASVVALRGGEDRPPRTSIDSPVRGLQCHAPRSWWVESLATSRKAGVERASAWCSSSQRVLNCS